MQIIETFATHITERIEPVVKVADRRPALLLQELSNLIITSQWEQYLRRLLDAWANTSDRVEETDPGIWISGFFGSGKSLLLKVLGVVLEGGELEGTSVHEVFLNRLPSDSPDRAEIKRLLTAIRRRMTTSFVGGNLHAMQSASTDSLALIAFKLFAEEQGYTRNWAFAWAVEYYIDQAGRKAEFQQRAVELTGQEWEELANDTAYYIDALMQAAADTLPDHFLDGRASVERTLAAATQGGITPNDIIDRFVRWCRSRDGEGKRHHVLLQFDELGQWIASGNSNERIMQVQALVETAGVRGEGRIWIAVTAHGDVHALQASVQQDQYAKINQRFSIKCKLSNDDMSQVVEERLLRKNQAGRNDLSARFASRIGEVTDLGTLRSPRRVYPPPTEEGFPLFYPYMPWTVKVIPDVVKGIAQAAGRGDALTGATRTMIAVVQGAILDTPGLLQAPVGRLLSLANLYPQLVADVPVETKTDLNRVRDSVLDATDRTFDVAVALYLLGQASHIPCTVENVARALVDRLDVNLGALVAQVEPELARLVTAGYAKQVGEEFLFLTTQQRSFQDKVRERQGELLNQPYKLSEALREYAGSDVFQLHQIQILGRTLNLKLVLDAYVIQAGQSRVTVQILSPLQRALDLQIRDDEPMRQKSNQEPNTFFLRLAEAPQLFQSLALAVATDEIADRVTAANPMSPEAEVARQAKLNDLSSHKAVVRKQLNAAMRDAILFFRGTNYHLTGGANAGDAARQLLSRLLPDVYSRLPEVQHRVANEDGAIKAALYGSLSNSDIRSLGVLKADDTINESSPLLSALRGVLPLENSDRPALEALEIRRNFEDPPYGWDGNAIKVGLALLLRAGLCKLVVDGRAVTDPNDPEAHLALARDQKFRILRVWGVQSEVSQTQLQTVRGYLETLFNVRSTINAATLNNAVGQALDEVLSRCTAVQQWAATVNFPLPTAFTAGMSVVQELLASAAPTSRLPRFADRYADLSALIDLLDRLEVFRTQSGQAFVQMRDYFNQMVNANLGLPALQTFLSDWNMLSTERSFDDPRRWNEILRSQQQAEAAVKSQIERWIAEAQQNANTLQERIPTMVREVGVPDAEIPQRTVTLIDAVERYTANIPPTPNLSTARALPDQFRMLQLDLEGQLERLREEFRPKQPVGTVRVKLRDYLQDEEISSEAELDAALARVRQSVLQTLKSTGSGI